MLNLIIVNILNDNFIYIGDSKKDIPIWLHCKKAILVGAKTNIIKKLIKNNVEIIFTFFAAYTLKTLELPISDIICAIPAIPK